MTTGTSSAQKLAIPDPSSLQGCLKDLVTAARLAETYAMLLTRQVPADQASVDRGEGAMLLQQQKKLDGLAKKYINEHILSVGRLLTESIDVADAVARATDSATEDAANTKVWSRIGTKAGTACQQAGKVRDALLSYSAQMEKLAEPFCESLQELIDRAENEDLQEVEEDIRELHRKVAADIAKILSGGRRNSTKLKEEIENIGTKLADLKKPTAGTKPDDKTPTKPAKPKRTATVDADVNGSGAQYEDATSAVNEKGGQAEDEEDLEVILARINANLEELARQYKEAARIDASLSRAIGLYAETNSCQWANEQMEEPARVVAEKWDVVNGSLQTMAKSLGQQGGKDSFPGTAAVRAAHDRWSECCTYLESLQKTYLS